jgi:hypothetical protein
VCAGGYSDKLLLNDSGTIDRERTSIFSVCVRQATQGHCADGLDPYVRTPLGRLSEKFSVPLSLRGHVWEISRRVVGAAVGP